MKEDTTGKRSHTISVPGNWIFNVIIASTLLVSAFALGLVELVVEAAVNELDHCNYYQAAALCASIGLALPNANRSNLLMLRSGALTSLGHSDDALADLNTLITQLPSANSYLFRARLYNRTGRLQEAFADSSKAIELNPNAPSAYWLRAHIIESTQGLNAAISDSIQAAKHDADKSLAIDIIKGRAQKCESANEFASAARYYSAAIAVATSTEAQANLLQDLYFMRAETFKKLRNNEQAIEDYAEALKAKVNPEKLDHVMDAKIYLARGCCNVNLSKYDQAISDFSNAVASCHSYLKKPAESFHHEMSDREHNDYENAPKVEVASLMNRGLIFEKLKLYDKAISDFSQGINIMDECRPRDLETVDRVCKIFGNEKRAQVLAETISFGNNKLAEAYFHRGFCYEHRDQPKLAKLDHTEADRLWRGQNMVQ